MNDSITCAARYHWREVLVLRVDGFRYSVSRGLAALLCGQQGW